MQTQCKHCNHVFLVADSAFGSETECPKCQQKFIATWYLSSAPTLPDMADEHEAEHEAEIEQPTPGRKRRTPAEVMAEQISEIETRLANLWPLIQASVKRQDNESSCRQILDKILTEALGFALEEIKTEQKIQGRRADYVLSVNDQDVLVIEAKKVGTLLKERQVFQAVSYGAHSGIRWALLTNLEVWQVYRILVQDIVTAHLVFTIDMRTRPGRREAEYLYLLSRQGLARKALLESLWTKVSCLNCKRLVDAILSEDVLQKIRAVLNRDAGCKLSLEEIRTALTADVFKLE